MNPEWHQIGCKMIPLLLITNYIYEKFSGPPASTWALDAGPLPWFLSHHEDTNDAYLRFLTPLVLIDEGVPTASALNFSEDDVQHVLDQAKSAKLRSVDTPKIATTRWSTVPNALDDVLETWHLRSGFGLMPKAIVSGSINFRKCQSFAQKLGPTDKTVIDAQTYHATSVARARAEFNRLRDHVANGFDFMSLCYLNEGLREDLVMISFAMQPGRYLYKRMNEHLRSTEASRAWHLDLVLGKGMFWEAVTSALHPFCRSDRHAKDLRKCGIVDSPEDINLNFGEDARFEQRRLCSQIWKLRLLQADHGYLLMSIIHLVLLATHADSCDARNSLSFFLVLQITQHVDDNSC